MVDDRIFAAEAAAIVTCPPSVARQSRASTKDQAGHPEARTGAKHRHGRAGDDSPPPSRYRSAAVRCGNAKAAASKSLQSWTSRRRRPHAAHRVDGPRAIGEYATLPVDRPGHREQCLRARPTAAITVEGSIDDVAKRGNWATVKYRSGPAHLRQKANRALVAPMSPNSTGSWSDPSVAPAIALRPQRPLQASTYPGVIRSAGSFGCPYNAFRFHFVA